MVPQEIDQIGPAIAKALEALETQLQRDRASVAKDRQADRRASGVAVLDAMIEGVGGLKSNLERGPDARSER